MQLDLFPDAVHLESVDPTRNRARFYGITVELDLFSNWLLVKRWGRIGTVGRSATHVLHSPVEALGMLGRAAESKGRRGYRRVGP